MPVNLAHGVGLGLSQGVRRTFEFLGEMNPDWVLRGSPEHQRELGYQVLDLDFEEWGANRAATGNVLMKGVSLERLDELKEPVDTFCKGSVGQFFTHAGVVIKNPPKHLLELYDAPSEPTDPKWTKHGLYLFEVSAAGETILEPLPDRIAFWGDSYGILEAKDDAEWQICVLEVCKASTGKPLRDEADWPEFAGLYSWVAEAHKNHYHWGLKTGQAYDLLRHLLGVELETSELDDDLTEASEIGGSRYRTGRRQHEEALICTEAVAEALIRTGVLRTRFGAAKYVPLSYCPPECGMGDVTLARQLEDDFTVGPTINISGNLSSHVSRTLAIQRLSTAARDLNVAGADRKQITQVVERALGANVLPTSPRGQQPVGNAEGSAATPPRLAASAPANRIQREATHTALLRTQTVKTLRQSMAAFDGDPDLGDGDMVNTIMNRSSTRRSVRMSHSSAGTDGSQGSSQGASLGGGGTRGIPWRDHRPRRVREVATQTEVQSRSQSRGSWPGRRSSSSAEKYTSSSSSSEIPTASRRASRRFSAPRLRFPELWRKTWLKPLTRRSKGRSSSIQEASHDARITSIQEASHDARM